MRILFSSHVFAPSVGGLESVSQMLAGEFVRQGHEVRLITQTAGSDETRHRYEVARRPSPRALLDRVRWCDIYFHNNISLPRAWPLLLAPRPWVVAHHVWIPRAGVAGRLKRIALRFATGISISAAIARHLPTASTVVPNPYDDAIFRRLPQVIRDRDLIFVGRLVSDKGANLLLSAVAALFARGLAPTVTLVGSGPEEPALRAQAAALGIAANVRFAGARRGHDLAALLNEHRILVVPSLWQEPFGIVALEGIACGCVPVGSEGGGLQDAIGDCGETFPNGDAGALTTVLERLLREPQRLDALLSPADRHLRRHQLPVVAARYLEIFAQAMTDRSARPHGEGAGDV